MEVVMESQQKTAQDKQKDEKKPVAPRQSDSELLKKLDNHPDDEFPETNN
jgi:hypothetical protein